MESIFLLICLIFIELRENIDNEKVRVTNGPLKKK